MKSLLASLALGVVLIASAALAGCTKRIPVDTTNLDYSFQTADPTNQAAISQAIESIDKADYAAALDKLKKVAEDPKLSSDQKSNVTAVIQKLETH